MGATDHRQHVMLTKADDANVPHHDQLVVSANLLECPFEVSSRFGGIAREKLTVRPRHPSWRIDQTLAIRIVPRPLDKNPNGRFGLGLRRLRHSPVSRIVLFGPVEHLGQGHTTKRREAIQLPGHSELHWTFPCTDRRLLVRLRRRGKYALYSIAFMIVPGSHWRWVGKEAD